MTFRYGIEGIYSYGQMERLKAFDSQLDSYLLPVDQLVLALYDCRSLRRFAILSHINVAVTSAVELDWPSLIFACFVLPQPICDSFKVNINSSNPAHICFVGSSMAESFHLPHVHRNDLIQMDSKVCKMPSKLSAGGFPCE